MTARPAIFQDQNLRYEANTCDALKEAWKEGSVNVCAWSHQPYPGIELAADYLPELRTIGMWDASGKQRWGLERHCNEGIEFTYLASGQLQFSVDGSTWELKPGQLTMTRPWQFHQVGQPEVTASKLYWFILDVSVRRPNQEWRWPSWLLLSPAELQELTSLLSHNEHPVWDASDTIRDAFEALIIELGLAHEQAVLTKLTKENAVHTATSPEDTQRLMADGVDVIYQAQLLDKENAALEAVAKAVGISKQ